jgi:hypothetical protein
MLKLNEDKTELIVFAPKHRLNNFRNCQLQFDGCVVSDAPFVKNLGIHFDKALSMEKHALLWSNRVLPKFALEDVLDRT